MRKLLPQKEIWLGGRDSNPDTVVQSHVSYRWTTSQYQSGVREGQELSIISARKQGRQARQTGTGHQLLTRNVVHRAVLAGVARIAALVVRLVAAAASLLFLLAAMARHPALAARFTRFFAGPLVRGPFLMRGLAALARNLALFASVHRRKSTILFGHHALLAYTSFVARANTRAATDVPHVFRNSQQ